MLQRELDTFLTVAERGSFLGASKALFLTPASVMHQIDKLEASLDLQLLHRSSRGVVLTPAGQSLYQDALALRQAAAQAVSRARQLAEPCRQIIRVGTSILRPCKALVELWSSLEAPPFQLDLVSFHEEEDGTEIMLAALGGQIDCFVSPCASPRWKQMYSVQPLGWEPSCIALPRTHPLARKSALTWADLEGESLLLVQQGKSQVLDRLRQEIHDRHPGVRVLDIPPIHGMDAFNLCSRLGCLMELPASWAELHPSLVTLPMAWEYTVEYGLLYAKEPSETMEAFLRWLRPLLPPECA